MIAKRIFDQKQDFYKKFERKSASEKVYLENKTHVEETSSHL